jgi:signal transduction histidine kinase
VTLREGPPPGRDGAFPAALLLARSLAATLAVGHLFTRWQSGPLGALAAAARAAGRGDRAVRVPEAGAHEVRKMTAAFNEMQGRIARFETRRRRLLAALGQDFRRPMTPLRIHAEMLGEAKARRRKG